MYFAVERKIMSLFITFEGLDACGKSTQVRLLEEHLRSHGASVSVYREPGGTPLGESIRSLLLDPANVDLTDAAELLLFSASRSQLVETVIRPSLESGQYVLCDRFYDSTTAYQGGGRGLDPEMVRSVNMAATGGLIPDATFFLDVPIPVLADRMRASGTSKDRMEANGVAFQTRVREAYLAVARQEERIHVLDGTRPVEELSREIWSVCELLEGAKHE